MNLREIREYIANITDYDPNVNKDYSAQVDNIINETYRRLFAEKPFTFAQKEKKIDVYTDVTDTADIQYIALNKVTQIDADNDLPLWIEGNIVEIDGTEYDVLYIDPSVATRCYIKENIGTLTSESIRFKQRFIRLPQDLVSLLQVGKRSMSISPTEVGRYIPLTRYEDEYYNLPLDEVNIPNYWIIQDSISFTGPTVAPVISATSTGSGQGTRTVRVAQTYVKYDANGQDYEIESGLSPFSDEITLSDTERLVVTLPTLPSAFGYARRIYIYNANQTPEFGGVYFVEKVDKGGGGSYNIDFTADAFTDGTFLLDSQRYSYMDGYLQQLRLYPRQDSDYKLSVRYIYRPDRLQEDTDTPEFPQSHHLILAYGSLMDIFNKHDNAQMSRIYRSKYNEALIKLEQRFLTQKPRRFVKGFMEGSGVDTVPMWTPLKRLQ